MFRKPILRGQPVRIAPADRPVFVELRASIRPPAHLARQIALRVPTTPIAP